MLCSYWFYSDKLVHWHISFSFHYFYSIFQSFCFEKYPHKGLNYNGWHLYSILQFTDGAPNLCVIWFPKPLVSTSMLEETKVLEKVIDLSGFHMLTFLLQICKLPLYPRFPKGTKQKAAWLVGEPHIGSLRYLAEVLPCHWPPRAIQFPFVDCKILVWPVIFRVLVCFSQNVL